jgi:hypothetical protein
MKRSMIVVCLLLLSPGGVTACIEDHNPGAGWYDQQPSGWSGYGVLGQGLHRDRVQDVSLFAGGLGITILVGVMFRAMCQASRKACTSDAQADTYVPLVMPMDAPAFDPSCEGVELASEVLEWTDPEAFDAYSDLMSGHSYAIDSAMSFS